MSVFLMNFTYRFIYRRFTFIYRLFNEKKWRPTRLFPNQPRMANYARSMKKGGGGMGVDGGKGGSCPDHISKQQPTIMFNLVYCPG